MAKRNTIPLLTVSLVKETDVLQARQRAKQIAEALNFETQDQTRIATAVSEIARNAWEYARGGKVEFLASKLPSDRLKVVVTDNGDGIRELDSIWDGTYSSASGMGLGIIGSKRLMDDLQIDTGPKGTTVTLTKCLPTGVFLPPIEGVVAKLAAAAHTSSSDALLAQNQETLRLLSDLRQRENELVGLNKELEETNRGVLALYSELEDRAQALQQASEMKSRFVSGITHELRTPLNSIVSLTGLLIRRIDGELTSEQEKQVLFVQRSAQNLTEMVNDLLDLSKIEAGKVSLRLSEFFVRDITGALRGMFRPLAMNENVALIFDETDASNVRIYSDEGKIAQILRNFIANALKFTREGSVTVKVTSQDHGSLLFAVTDTGAGIAPEHHELVWQEWGQVESDERPRHKGSGLGLPLARQLANLLGGSTWLESEPKRGSTFYLELPPSVTKQAETSAGSQTPNLVLAVEDDEVARYLLRRNLVGLTAAQLVEAISLQDARSKLLELTPAIILLDIVLPDGNGITFAEELHADPRLKDVPVVLMTSKPLTPQDRERIDRLQIQLIDKEGGDHQDQKSALERALMNVGLMNLHNNEAAL